MARTTQEIYNDLEAQIIASPTLGVLANNTSKTAIWRLFLWVCAYASNFIENLFDTFREDMDVKILEAIPGTVQWYVNEIKKFQLGDTMVFINDKLVYETEDITKRIITHCVAIERDDPLIGGVLDIKVAKTVSGNLAALDSTELAQLNAYISKIKFAGTKTVTISTSGDILKISFNIYFDQILSLTVVKNNVIAVINKCIKELPFNGVLNITKLIDKIQEVDGVNDAILVYAESKTSVGTSYQPFEREAQPYGGYFTISTTPSETLSTTIIMFGI